MAWMNMIAVPFLFILTFDHVIGYSVCPGPCTCTENEEISVLRGITEIDVDCRNKDLREIPELTVLENVTVHRIYLNGNKLTSIPDNLFDGLRVAGIELSDNPLSHISKHAFKGLDYFLEYLSMQRISLNHPPHEFLSGLIMLRSLDLTGVATPIMRSLSNGTFGYLRMLETLVLKECGIETMDDKTFEGVESILELRLSGNKISTIPRKAFRPLIELRTLNLDQNQIDSIPNSVFIPMMNLQKLSLSDNKISDHTKIEEQAFYRVGHSLMELDLSFNQLTRVPARSFDNLFNLGILKLSDNKLTELNEGDFETMRHLMTLDLSGNEITVTPEVLRGLEMSLGTLLLSRTGMTAETIPVKALRRLHYLKELDLSGNQLGSLNNSSFSGLTVQRIIMPHCDITDIESDTFSELRQPLHVELNFNNIQDVTFITDQCLFKKVELNDNPVDCSCDLLEVVQYETTQILGQCASPPELQGQDIAMAAIKPEITEQCMWGNLTDTDKLCEWMPGSTTTIHTKFITSAFSLILVTAILNW